MKMTPLMSCEQIYRVRAAAFRCIPDPWEKRELMTDDATHRSDRPQLPLASLGAHLAAAENGEATRTPSPTDPLRCCFNCGMMNYPAHHVRPTRSTS